jgi:cell division septal protein FtsQ
MKWIRQFVLTLLSVVVGSFLVYSLFSSNVLRVSGVQLELDPVSSDQATFARIRSSLSSQFLQFDGRFLWQISLDELKKLTMSDSRVEALQIHRVFPNQLKVVVRPQKSAFVILESDHSVRAVALDGRLLPSQSLMESDDLPVVRGKLFLKSLKQRQRLVEILSSIPKKGRFSQVEISEIVRTERGDLKVLLKTDEHVFLPKEMSSSTSDRIERVLNYLDSRHMQGRVIDARYSKKIVVRLRNES